MTTITGISTTALTAAMPRPWVPSAPWLHLVRVDVECSDGVTGTGFSWTPTIGAAAVRALIDTDIAGFAVGRSAAPRELWPELWRHLHEAGGAGVTTIAMAGLDLALWDAAGRRASLGLADLVGRVRGSVGVYASGVNLHYSVDELVAQAQRWVDAGYDAVKIKVGKPDLAEDVDRVGAVREVIGARRELMIDANQRWDVATAVTAIGAFERFDLHWVEEPLRSDDTLGYLELRGSIGVPIAMGENVHTAHRFRELATLGAADVLQPNVIRVGGITPFLEIAELVDAADLVLAPHLLPELSGQLAMAIAQQTRVERVEDADLDTLGLLDGPSPVRFSTDAAGTGATRVGQPGGSGPLTGTGAVAGTAAAAGPPTLSAPGAPGLGIPLVRRSPMEES